MWLLGGVPVLVFVVGGGMVAFGAAVSWVAFRQRGSFGLATALAVVTLAVGTAAWRAGIASGHPLAVIPFQIAAAATIGAGLVMVLGELARARRGDGKDGEDDEDRWPPT